MNDTAKIDAPSGVGVDALVRPRFSLHRNRSPKNCDLCGCEIPVRQPPDWAEYWRVKGGDALTPRVLCCLCHELFGFPSHGWEYPADGVETISAATPAPGRGAA